MNQYAWGAAMDGEGNVIVTGTFQGTLDFGGGGLTSPGNYDAWDVFVAKLDRFGNHVWSKRFGDEADQGGQSTAVDDQGNVIVTGSFGGTIDFGGGVLTDAGGGDVFVAKFDSAGNHLWSRRFGDGSTQTSHSVAVDDQGNAIVVGYFEGTLDFGGGPLTGMGGLDIFVAKFDADGNHLWSHRYGDAAYFQFGYSVGVDGLGNVVVAGWFDGTVDFGGGPLTGAGRDVYVAKFDANGNHLWSKRFGDALPQLLYSAAVDGQGSVILSGYFEGTIDFGGGPLTSVGILGVYDLFVAKLDAGGNHVWSKRFGDTTTPYRDQYALGTAVDSQGNVIVTGYFYGTLDFGGGVLSLQGLDSNIFIARLDAGGNHLWSGQFGHAVGQGAVTDHQGNVIAFGRLGDRANFGGVDLTSAGTSDIFVVKFSPAPGEEPECAVTPVSVNFDTVLVGSDKEATVTLYNSGSVILTGDIHEFCPNYDIVSGGGVYSLSPGDSVVVTVRFEPEVGGPLICYLQTGHGECDVSLVGVGKVPPVLELALGILQNPYLTQFIDIFVTASGTLDSTSMVLTVDGERIPMELIDATENVWKADYELGKETAVDVEACATSALGASDCVSTSIGAFAVTEGELAVVSSRDGVFRARIEEESLNGSGYVLVIPSASVEPSAVAPQAPNPPTGREVRLYTLSPASLLSSGSVNVEFHYGDIDLPPGTEESQLCIEHAQVGPLSSVIDFNRGVVRAGAGALGEYRLVVGASGSSRIADPRSLRLDPNYPNPFNPTTTVRFEIDTGQHVRLCIYDAAGRLVRTLVDEAVEGGVNLERWDGKAENGNEVASGIYFVHIQTASRTATRKMVLVR
jgi:hypothetical protein